MMRLCPGCKTEQPGADFLAGLCLACFGAGKQVPLGPLDTPADEARRVRAHRKRARTSTESEGETPRDVVHHDAPQEGVMALKQDRAEMATCDVCGKECRRQGLGVHKARAHGHGGNGDASPAHPKVKIVARPASLPEPRVDAAAPVATNGHCQECLFRDLERHIDQDLVRRAVVGGMALDAACAFVREAKVALGSAS